MLQVLCVHKKLLRYSPLNNVKGILRGCGYVCTRETEREEGIVGLVTVDKKISVNQERITLDFFKIRQRVRERKEERLRDYVSVCV